jgi:cation diffusion facilitator family transporter
MQHNHSITNDKHPDMVSGIKTPASEEACNIARIKRITWLGMVINIFLAGLKLALGIFGGSQALVADAVHSFSDMSTDVAVLFGVKFWSAPPDESHPYGHKRIETLITAAIGFFLGLVAIGIGYNALMSIWAEQAGQPSWVALIGALLSIVFKEFVYRWTVAVGKQVKSPAVVANAWHHRTDALSSIPVAIAIAAAAINPTWAFLDYVGAVIVSIFILHTAWGIISSTLAELIDQGVPQEDHERLATLATATPGVISVHAIRTRRMSSALYVDLHVMVNGYMTVEKGHEIAKEVKQNLVTNHPDAMDVVVHLEPSPLDS